MAEFQVKPSALDAFAGTLGAGSGSASTLNSAYLIDYSNYADAHVEVGGQGLLFQWLRPKLEEIRERLDSDSLLVSTHLLESGYALQSSATTYRTTDTVQARTLDSVYQPGGITPLDDTVTTATGDLDPAAALSEPGDDGGVPDLAQELLDAGGVFSVSDLVIKILRWCGLDVMEWPRDKLAGDPHEIARAMHALENLATFNGDAAMAIATGSGSMFDSWSGNAADAARSYFDQTANGLADYATAMSGVATKMQTLIVSIQEGMAALEGALTTLIDKGIQCAVKVAAAGCLAEVPGIDIVVAIVGAESVYELVNSIHKFFDIWNVVWAGHEGILGLITGLAGGLVSYDLSANLPAASYHNDSQGPAPAPAGASPRPGGPR